MPIETPIPATDPLVPDSLVSNPLVPERWLTHLEEHLPIAVRGEDPEGVHQLRVAAARLDGWLRVAERPVLRRDLRRFRRLAGPLRDLDVLLEADPPAAWIPWLEERRGHARRRFLAALEEPEFPELLQRLRSLPALPRATMEAGRAGFAAKLVDRGRALERDPENLEACHDLRRALRRYRYAREWLGESTRSIRPLQKILGNLNDTAVTLALVEEWEDRAEIADFVETLRRDLDERRRRAVAAWLDGSSFP